MNKKMVGLLLVILVLLFRYCKQLGYMPYSDGRPRLRWINSTCKHTEFY